MPPVTRLLNAVDGRLQVFTCTEWWDLLPLLGLGLLAAGLALAGVLVNGRRAMQDRRHRQVALALGYGGAAVPWAWLLAGFLAALPDRLPDWVASHT